MEHISSNLSNINSTGYKERRVSFETIMAQAGGGKLSEGYVALGDGNVDERDGNLIQDNVDTHFAIRGEGYFAVQNNDGETLMMRSGAFQLDTQGFLVNQLGERVLTTTGPLQFDDYQRSNFTLSADGRFLDERGAEFAQLLIVNSSDEKIEPLAATRWRADNIEEITEPTNVVQGALENSNVNPFRSMIEMLETSRHFEMYQKSMQASTEMDNNANQMARRSQ
jgi:flagellar basal body rod protein FlgG